MSAPAKGRLAKPTCSRLLELVAAMRECELVVIADLVCDRFLIGRPARISREAPVLILEQEEEWLRPGGGANTTANVRALGGRPIPVGVVGDDEAGQALVQSLAKVGIDTKAIQISRGYQTPTKTRILGGGAASSKQQIVRIDRGSPLSGGADLENALIERGSVLLDDLFSRSSAGQIVVACDYGYGAARPRIVSALQKTAGGRARVIVDSRYRLGEFRHVLGATPNQEEAESLADCALGSDQQLKRHGPRILGEMDADFLLVTRGSRGMALFERDAPATLIPIHGSDQVTDVTGAGDTVTGTVALALRAGASALEASLLANYAAGVVVQKAGTSTVSPEELSRAIGSDPELLEQL